MVIPVKYYTSKQNTLSKMVASQDTSGPMDIDSHEVEQPVAPGTTGGAQHQKQQGGGEATASNKRSGDVGDTNAQLTALNAGSGGSSSAASATAEDDSKRRKLDSDLQTAATRKEDQLQLPLTTVVSTAFSQLVALLSTRLGLNKEDANVRQVTEDLGELKDLDDEDWTETLRMWSGLCDGNMMGARSEFAEFAKEIIDAASASNTTEGKRMRDFAAIASPVKSLVDSFDPQSNDRAFRKWTNRIDALCKNDPASAKSVLKQIQIAAAQHFSSTPPSETMFMGVHSDTHRETLQGCDKMLKYADAFENFVPACADQYTHLKRMWTIVRELGAVVEDEGSAQRINGDLLPELQKLCGGLGSNDQALASLARRWVSDHAAEYSWIDAAALGEDFGDIKTRQKKLSALQSKFFRMETVTLSDYNRVTQRHTAEKMRENVRSWLAQPTSRFKELLLPIMLNILKRGEAWDEFLSIGIHEIESTPAAKQADLSALWSAKALFCILYESAEAGVRFRLLRDFRDALPLLHPRTATSASSNETKLLRFNPDLCHLIPRSECGGALISFALGDNSPAMGKSGILNELFSCNFEQDSRSFASYGTCDVDLGLSFKPRRSLVFADVHGGIKRSAQTTALLSLFPSWLIHIPASEVDRCLEMLMEFLQDEKFSLADGGPQAIMILIRDADALQSEKFTVGAKSSTQMAEKLEKFQKSMGDTHAKISIASMRDLTKLPQRERETVLKFELQPLLSGELMNVVGLGGGGREVVRKYGVCNQDMFCRTLREVEDDHPEFATPLCLVTDLLKTIKTFGSNFFDAGGLATRDLLIKFRKCRQKLENPSATPDAIEEARAEEKQIRDALSGTRMTPLLQQFLQILQSPSRVVLMSVLAESIKRFSDDNVREQIEKRREINDRRTALYAAGPGVVEGGSDEDAAEKHAAELERLSSELVAVTEEIEQKRISVELLWRELLVFYEHDIAKNESTPANPVGQLCNFLRVGEPFELIDGDTLQIPHKTLQEAFRQVALKLNIGGSSAAASPAASPDDEAVPMDSRESLLPAAARKPGKRVMVISILGPQSSGKSTLLNYLFGCKFNTAKGRCTKGVYGSLIEITHEHYDYLLILDTEGLQSPEKLDHEFDRKITLFCLAVSHFVIINVAKDMNAHMRDLLEICLFSLDQLQKARMATPTNFMVFNQHSGDTADKSMFMDQVKGISEAIIAAKPEAVDAARAMQFPSERIKVLPLATNSFTIPKDPARGVMEDWNQERPATKFAVEVAQFGKEIMDLALENRADRRVATPASALSNSLSAGVGGNKNAGTTSAGGKAFQQEDLEAWIRMATDNWTTITAFPDLYRFANVKLLKDSRRLNQIAREKEQQYLSSSEAQVRHMKRKKEVLAEHVVDSKLLNRDYFENVTAKVENQLRGQYFEQEVHEHIRREFDVVLRNQQFDKTLVNNCQQYMQTAVQNAAESLIAEARADIQQRQMGQSKVRGVDKLHALERDLTKTGVAEEKTAQQRKKLVDDEFEKVWATVVQEMETELSRSADKTSSSWEALKSSYLTMQKLPSCVGGEKDVELAMLSKLHTADKNSQRNTVAGGEAKSKTGGGGARKGTKNTRSLANKDDANANGKASTGAVIGSELIARQQLKNFLQRIPATLANAARRGLAGINDLYAKSITAGQPYCYLNIFEHFDVMLETRTWSLDLVKHIDYSELRTQLEDLGKIVGWGDAVTKKIAQQRVNQFRGICIQFEDLGLDFRPEFSQEMKSVLTEQTLTSQLGFQGDRVDNIRKVLSKYSCFSTSSPSAPSAGAAGASSSAPQAKAKPKAKSSAKMKAKAKKGAEQDQVEEQERFPFDIDSESCLQLPIPVGVIRAGAYEQNMFVAPLDQIEEIQHTPVTLSRGQRNSRTFKVPTSIDPEELNGREQYYFRPKEETRFENVLDALQKIEDYAHVQPDDFHLFFKESSTTWKSALEELEWGLDQVLQGIDNSSAGCSRMAQRVHSAVNKFLQDHVNQNLGLLGVVLDMDGEALFHWFALLHVYRVLSGRTVQKSRQPLMEFVATKENWRDHLQKVVGADPAGKTVAAATRFVADLKTHLLQAETTRTGEVARPEMTALLGESFTGAAIQERLDRELLFNAAADHDRVVQYVTQQHVVIQEEFESKWFDEMMRLQSRLLADCASNVKRNLSRAVDHVSSVLRFAHNRAECGGGSADNVVDLARGDRSTLYYDRDAQQSAAAQAQFFLTTCHGGVDSIVGSHWSFTNDDGTSFEVALQSSGPAAHASSQQQDSADLTAADIQGSIITSWGSMADILPPNLNMSAIPMLELFLNETSTRLKEEIEDLEIEEDDVAWGLDELFDRTKRKAIGCCHTCPTCGRKCDQEIDGPGEHKHACRLGHQMRCMAGVTVDKKPSFQTCDEIADDGQVQDLKTGEWITWAEQKKKYADWEFKYCENAADELHNIRKFRECWKFHGQQICAAFSGSGMQYSDVKPRDLHIVFVIEDSPKHLKRAYKNLTDEKVRDQYCSVVLTSATQQKCIVIEKPARDVIDHDNETIRRGLADEQESIDVSTLVLRSQQSYHRQKLWNFGSAQWPPAALESLLAHEESGAIKFSSFTYSCNHVRHNKDGTREFVNPYGIGRARVLYKQTTDPAGYMLSTLTDFDSRKLAMLPEEIGRESAATVVDGKKKNPLPLTQYSRAITKKKKRADAINDLDQGAMDNEKARKILELPEEGNLADAVIKKAYKKAQIELHPDHMPEELRDGANKALQTATTAKDYLLPRK